MSKRKTYTMGRRLVILGIAGAVALTGPRFVEAAASPQVCTVAQTCSIGEFLFDDDYQPITSGTCTFTSRNPNGTIYLNAEPLTSTADGYYAHTFATPSTEGIYRSQICCTAGSDYLCIDKSFEARATSQLTQSDVSNAVWNSSRSTHTTSGSFGEALQNIAPASSDVASAVWGYSGRTLSSFSSLITDIWSNSSRSLTSANLSSGSLAQKSDVTVEVKETTNNTHNTYNTTSAGDKNSLNSIKKDVRETRLLLEKQVNKPIFENSIEDSADLPVKLKLTQTKAQSTYFSLAQTHKSLLRLQKTWPTLSREQRLDQINKLVLIVGEPTDKESAETLFGTTQWFTNQWDFTISKTMSKNVTDLYNSLKQTQRQLVSGSVYTVSFPSKTINTSVLLKVNVGEIGDDEVEGTLFSGINEMNQIVADLADNERKLNTTLKGWKKLSRAAKEETALKLSTDILALNRIPHVNAIVKPFSVQATDKDIQNRVFFLSGLVKANKSYLANNAHKSFASSWLELGSIVFKTLVTNPSTLITQDAPVKYYLPPEVKKENILEIDKGLTLKLDEAKSQYYVSGTFKLEPGESKIVSVRVSDVWLVSEQELKTLKSQAQALTKPLEKTSYFAQGVTLGSDIDVAVEKIALRQSRAETPEEKIVAFREAQIELDGVRLKMDKLKDLAAQSSSTGSLFGFVGATQTLAVWGLIIIISAGFIFLTIYMRKLSEVPGNTPAKKEPEEPAKPAVEPAVEPVKSVKSAKAPATIQLNTKVKAFVVAFVLTYGAATASTSAYITSSMQAQKPTQASAPHVSPVRGSVLGSVATKTQPWCVSDGTTPTWAPKVAEKTQEPKKPQEYATVTETPTGWLRVRQTPSGAEVAKVDVGTSFPLIEKTDAWMKIKLEDNTTGWVSSRYVAVAPQKAEAPE